MGVGGCGCPVSSRASRNNTVCLQLRKRAHGLASVAEATTKRKIAHSLKNALLNVMGFVGFAFHPMNNGHVLCCVCAILRGRISLSKPSLSCQMRGILPLRRDMSPSNP